jgi:hypothetical protein
LYAACPAEIEVVLARGRAGDWCMWHKIRDWSFCLAHWVGLGGTFVLALCLLLAAIFFGRDQWLRAVELFHPWWFGGAGTFVLVYVVFLGWRIHFYLTDHIDSLHTLGWDWRRRHDAEERRKKKEDDPIKFRLIAPEMQLLVNPGLQRKHAEGYLVRAILESLVLDEPEALDQAGLIAFLTSGRIEEAQAGDRDVLSVRVNVRMIMAAQKQARRLHTLFPGYNGHEEEVAFNYRKESGSLTSANRPPVNGDVGRTSGAQPPSYDMDATWKSGR